MRAANEQRPSSSSGCWSSSSRSLIPWLAFRSNGDAATRRPGGPRRPEERPEPLPDQLRHLPHALRGGHRRQLRPEPRRTAGAPGPPEGPSAAATIKATEGRVLNAVENGVDSTHHPGPDARRHPQRGAGQGSRRIRRPHRRRGLTAGSALPTQNRGCRQAGQRIPLPDICLQSASDLPYCHLDFLGSNNETPGGTRKSGQRRSASTWARPTRASP